jgi:hypothetical protein
MSLFENLPTFNLDEVSAENHTELWFVHYQGSEYGPFDTGSLKSLSEEKQEEFEDVKIRSAESHTWEDFYSHTRFQRREPKLVPAQSLVNNDSFLVLIEGVKKGPFTLNELKEQIAEHSVRLSDQISVDEGQTWIKIFEHHQFDRRHRIANDLPENTDALLIVQKEQEKKKFESRDEKTALAGLAFLGKHPDKDAVIPIKKVKTPSKKEIIAKKKIKKKVSNKVNKKAKKINNKMPWAKGIIAASIVFAAVFGYEQFVGFDTDSDFPSRAANTNPTQINDTQRDLNLKRSPASRLQDQESKERQKTRQRLENRKARRAQNKKRDKFDREFEALDIDDPRVREELYREFASEEPYEEEYEDGYNDEPGYDEGYGRDQNSPSQMPRNQKPNRQGNAQGEDPYYDDQDYDEGEAPRDEFESDYMEVETFD